jgi:hypothetical protein
MIYASSHLTLATLECLVHCDKDSLSRPRITLRFGVEDALLEALPFDQLPENWNTLPEPESTKKRGDAWAKRGHSLGLIVPSATLVDGSNVLEKNVLLNPNYPKLSEQLGEPELELFALTQEVKDLWQIRAGLSGVVANRFRLIIHSAMSKLGIQALNHVMMNSSPSF